MANLASAVMQHAFIDAENARAVFGITAPAVTAAEVNSLTPGAVVLFGYCLHTPSTLLARLLSAVVSAQEPNLGVYASVRGLGDEILVLVPHSAVVAVQTQPCDLAAIH